MKKSNKKIPKTHLPKYEGGGSNFNEFGFNVEGQGQGPGTQNIYNEGRAKSNMLGTNQKLTGNQYAQMGQAVAQGGMQAYQTSQTPGLSEYEKNQQYGNSIKSAETGVVSAINPIFGMIHAGVTAATAPLTAKATQTDEQGNLKNKNFAKADIIGQGFADPMAMIPTMISNKFSMKKYISSVEDDAKGKIAAQKAQEDAYAQQQTDYQNQQQSMMDAAFARGYANQNQTGGNTYVQYAMGGMKFGMGGANAEIESEENVVAPNGGFLQANGPTHENGGVPVSLPGNSMIFSDRLKLGKKTFADLNKVNNTNKEDKVLESNKYGNTSKSTAELMKMAKNKNSEMLFKAQEALKQAKVEAYAKRMGVKLPSTDNESMEQGQSETSEGEYRMGGKLPMYPLGGGVDNTKFTPSQRQQAYTDSMTLYNSGLGNQANFKVQGSNDALHSLHLLNKTFPQPVSTRTVNTPAGSEIVSQYQKPVYNPSMVKKAKPIINNTNPEKFQKMEMRGLDYTPEPNINPQIQQVPANVPYTGSTQIITGPNFSQKLYKDSTGKELDKSYFDPTRKNVEIEPFRNGGRMLPKFDRGGKMVNGTWVPDNYDIITAHNATNSYKPGTIGYYDSMNSPDKPSNDSLQSSYGPEVLPWNRSNDSGNSAAYDNTVNPQQFQEVTSNSKSNIGSPKVTDPNDKNFDWKGLGTNVAMGLANNAGNIFNLTRYNKPEVTKFERSKANLLDPTSALRDATEQTRRAEYNVRNASGGNAGTYLSNRVALNAQNIENKDRIRQQYANANAGILNQNSQFNTNIANQEYIANEQNRARTRSGKGEAFGSIGSNVANQMMDNKKTNMDQETLGLMMKYYNDPQFKKYLEESGFNKKKTGK